LRGGCSGYRAGMHRFVRSGVGVMCAFATLAACSSGEADHPATALPPTDTTSDPATVVPPPSTTAASSVPATSPTASPGPTSSQSTAPVKPVLAPAAEADTAGGAKAVARFWHEALGYAFQTGNTAPLKSVAGPGCEACQNYSAGVDAEVKKGLEYRSEPLRILGVGLSKFQRTSAVVRVVLVAGQVRLYDPKSRTTKLGSKPHRGIDRVYLSWLDGRWQTRHVYLDTK
jgi:hypothetical protein